MGVNRVYFGSEKIIDISKAGVTPADVVKNVAFYDKNGDKKFGELDVITSYEGWNVWDTLSNKWKFHLNGTDKKVVDLTKDFTLWTTPGTATSKDVLYGVTFASDGHRYLVDGTDFGQGNWNNDGLIGNTATSRTINDNDSIAEVGDNVEITFNNETDKIGPAGNQWGIDKFGFCFKNGAKLIIPKSYLPSGGIDPTGTTATANDVISGLTFYSGTGSTPLTMKTGTIIDNRGSSHTCTLQHASGTSTTDLYFTVPGNGSTAFNKYTKFTIQVSKTVGLTSADNVGGVGSIKGLTAGANVIPITSTIGGDGAPAKAECVSFTINQAPDPSDTVVITYKGSTYTLTADKFTNINGSVYGACFRGGLHFSDSALDTSQLSITYNSASSAPTAVISSTCYNISAGYLQNGQIV